MRNAKKKILLKFFFEKLGNFLRKSTDFFICLKNAKNIFYYFFVGIEVLFLIKTIPQKFLHISLKFFQYCSKYIQRFYQKFAAFGLIEVALIKLKALEIFLNTFIHISCAFFSHACTRLKYEVDEIN